jgi:S-DNA-T family DNA segregation ATPase FtsK/SpoIIIE
LVIQALTKVARKPGSAADEFREFFERRAEQLETDVSLFVEWEEFVHGRRVECTDLSQGIFKCLHRSVRGLSPHEPAYVVLEGKQQSKPNSFIEMSQRACEYFERAYGALEAKTKKKIQFSRTLICNYSSDVLPKIKDKPKFKGSSKTGRATTLNFLVLGRHLPIEWICRRGMRCKRSELLMRLFHSAGRTGRCGCER